MYYSSALTSLFIRIFSLFSCSISRFEKEVNIFFSDGIKLYRQIMNGHLCMILLCILLGRIQLLVSPNIPNILAEHTKWWMGNDQLFDIYEAFRHTVCSAHKYKLCAYHALFALCWVHVISIWALFKFTRPIFPRCDVLVRPDCVFLAHVDFLKYIFGFH